MKILQLNVWTGRIKGALLDFIKENDFDIICLQEAVWSDNLDLLEHFAVSVEQIKQASELKYESRVANWGINAFNSIVKEGIVILSRYKIVEEHIETVYGEYQVASTSAELRDHCYNTQLIKLENNLNILNYHGYWKPTPVGDEKTTAIMRKVASQISNINEPLIMCGDLNIIHDSPAMREIDFLRDLTHEYHIKNTLSGLKFNGQVACDHILVNDKIIVNDFIVLDKIVSDHKPLIADINITEHS